LVSDECRIQKESGITSIWYQRGKYPEIKVEQVKQALSFYGALDVKTGRKLFWMLPVRHLSIPSGFFVNWKPNTGVRMYF